MFSEFLHASSRHVISCTLGYVSHSSSPAIHTVLSLTATPPGEVKQQQQQQQTTLDIQYRSSTMYIRFCIHLFFHFASRGWRKGLTTGLRVGGEENDE